MENIQNIQNLDSIIFYSGENALVAAEYTEERNYGKTVEGLGTLTKASDASMYFSNYPNVRYKERTVTFDNMNDLYSETLSYVLSNHDSEDIIGNSYIANNRYNVIYTYETDLQNDFGTAREIVKDNLEEFLIGLNNQKYNKEAKYGNKYEVSTIKIDQTYFKWYPENTIAYYNTEYTYTAYTYTYYFINDLDMNVYDGEENEILTAYLQEYLAATGKEELANNDYIHEYSYSGEIVESKEIPYKIGGNYYSYIRQSYATIDGKLSEKIDDNLTAFENKYNNDPSIYAYYMYDCNSDIKMLINSLNLGVKESTFKIGFDSRFNKWFDNIININAELNEGDTIANITSYKDEEIFSIFKNKTDRITGENVQINKDETLEFKTNANVSLEDNINILTPYSIDTLDLSPIKTKISNILDLTESNWMESGLNLKSLILDDDNDSEKSNIEKIFGINELTSLQYLNISNIDKLTRTPAIDNLENLKVFKAKGSNIDSFRPKAGITMLHVDLPETVKSIKLVNNKFEEGSLKVGGQLVDFDGLFDYIPNAILTSLTLRNIDDELSYNLVTKWFDAVQEADLLDSVIYLELNGIDWKNVPVQRLIDIKHFDINPNLSGQISLYGSGNYHYITRQEYQDILKLYGVNAFVSGNSVNDKVFKNLNLIINENKRETFEFNLSVVNKNVKQHNIDYPEITLTNNLFVDTLPIQFKGYWYTTVNGEIEASPYINRAANSLLDIIYGGQTEFTFIKDELADFAYCKLNNSIDTAASDEVKNIKAGDILLFNGDTLVIYFKDTVNSLYEYIKLGSIVDEKVMSAIGSNLSSIEHWFDYGEEAVLEFIPSERETVLDEFDIDIDATELTTDEDSAIITITLPQRILDAIAENKIANTKINVEADSEDLIVEQISDTEWELTPNYNWTSTKDVLVSVYADANREDTEIQFNITLKAESTVEVEDTTLVFASLATDVEERTLVISEANEVEYDEDTRTLIIY